MTPQERLIATAEDQVGYTGKKSNDQLDDFKANTPGLYNKFARDLDALGDFYNGRKQGFDWCDVFADWCLVTTFGRELAQKLLCQPDKSCGAGTGYSLGYYKSKGRLFTTPQPGDQIFFGTATVTQHTGIVTAVSGGYVHTVEGNAGSPSAVRACKYPLSYKKIKGYGRPDWSLVPEDKPTDGKEDDDMKYYAKLADVPASYKPTNTKLMERGALKGVADPDRNSLEDNVLNISQDYCRVMTTLDNLGCWTADGRGKAEIAPVFSLGLCRNAAEFFHHLLCQNTPKSAAWSSVQKQEKVLQTVENSGLRDFFTCLMLIKKMRRTVSPRKGKVGRFPSKSADFTGSC